MPHPFEHSICAGPECHGPRLPGKTICALRIRTEISENIHTRVRRHEAKMRFHQRRQSGDYGYLFDEPLRAILAEAGDELTTTDELGAVRYAPAKRLAEGDDPSGDYTFEKGAQKLTGQPGFAALPKDDILARLLALNEARSG